MKVLLLDDHHLFREGTKRMLEDNGDIKVVISTDSGKKALRLAQKNPPELAVVDLSMPEMDGIEFVCRLRSRFPNLPILVLSMHEEAQYALRAFEAGALGYLTKKAIPKDLLSAIKSIKNRVRYIPEEIKDCIAMSSAEGLETLNPLDSLSKREFQVLIGLAEGHTNRDIAQTYNISIKTVDTFRSRLLHKLNLGNNVQLSRFAVRHGLIEA